ncbi:hypothetical protein [Sphingomonas fuzhouensis]|uniref:hypothetical protein n=1 Tax=Sphingomonas fuzhouensis TaxID=3106033 RepID=UPI002AFE36EF|nr:hypothetical protein [Sphingomonas sp. SGZ-02]
MRYGCPPGLTPYRDGCAAPAGLQPIAPGPGWANWFPAQYVGDGEDWAYRDGYLYRYDPLGNARPGGLAALISAFIPLVGGALFNGNVWPQGYGYDQVPRYYDRFYGAGYDGDYNYRYADDTIFAVDQGSNRINSIAGLLTGDAWRVGQPMPVGYDIYNVPEQYRDQYVDGPDHWYRYADGYVYDVDPTTQLVRAVSQLLR